MLYFGQRCTKPVVFWISSENEDHDQNTLDDFFSLHFRLDKLVYQHVWCHCFSHNLEIFQLEYCFRWLEKKNKLLGKTRRFIQTHLSTLRDCNSHLHWWLSYWIWKFSHSWLSPIRRKTVVQSYLDYVIATTQRNHSNKWKIPNYPLDNSTTWCWKLIQKWFSSLRDTTIRPNLFDESCCNPLGFPL